MLKRIYKNLDYILRGSEIGLFHKIKLKLTPRFNPLSLPFAGKRLYVPDSAGFMGCYQEIFVEEVYRFPNTSPSPFIIDCGSNIGVSVIWFKQNYPQAKVIAFEPDKEIFNALKQNVERFGFTDIELNNKAIWISNDELSFVSEGGLSGKISDTGSNASNIIRVRAQRLKDYLNRPVDFLKIDIEGAEYEVLKDCKEELKNVKYLFVEYHSAENQDQKLDEILQILTSAGLRYHIKEAYTSEKPFMSRPAMVGMDLQLNIFAYRD